MADKQTDLGQKLWKQWDKLNAYRNSIFDSPAQDITNYFAPDISDINTEKTEGTTSWFDRIYDSAPMRAVTTCSVGVRNWVTPSTEPWLGLAPPYYLSKGKQAQQGTNARVSRISGPQSGDANDNAMDEASRWCDATAAQITEELTASNFYSIIQPFNRGACTLGTALLFVDEGDPETFHFEQFKFGTFVIAENAQKRVDKVKRRFKLTVSQAVEKFCKKLEDGEYDTSNLPKKMQEAYAKGKFEDMFFFIHHVMPMREYKILGGDIDPLVADGKAFASAYQAEQDKKIVKEGGYPSMPYFALRWSRWGTDDQAYGCSPAFETLPEARQINFITQNYDAKVELDAFPRVLVPDNLSGELQMASGGMTTVGAEDLAKGAIPKEWLTGGTTEGIVDILARKEKAINDAFFVSLFLSLSQLGDKITSSTLGAIALLQGEKLDQFTGTFDQYRTDLINPLIPRLIEIMASKGLLKPAPQSMMVRPNNDPKADPELAIPKINIKSRVSLAMGEVRNIGVQKTIEMLGPVAEQKPEIMDNFNWDEIARGAARSNGMPETMINPWAKMTALREARQKQVAQQQALEKAKLASESAKNLGKAPQKFQDAAGGQLEQFTGGQGQQTGS